VVRLERVHGRSDLLVVRGDDRCLSSYRPGALRNHLHAVSTPCLGREVMKRTDQGQAVDRWDIEEKEVTRASVLLGGSVRQETAWDR
jgi:hypothetical protein